jgi:hypothetical protein
MRNVRGINSVAECLPAKRTLVEWNISSGAISKGNFMVCKNCTGSLWNARKEVMRQSPSL